MQHNIRTEGDFEFVQIDAKNTTDGNRKRLKVTPSHAVILIDHDGRRILDLAEHIKVGDRIIASNGDILSVTEVDSVVMRDKCTLETADGTVLASEVLVSTICKEELNDGERPFERTMKDWRLKHNFSEGF